MNTASFCIKHKVTTLLAVIMISIFGVVFTSRLQMALLPDMEAPMAMDGASNTLAGAGETGSTPMPESRKWIVTVYMSAETDDLDAMTATFKEYTDKTVKKHSRPSVLQKLQQFKERIKSAVMDRTKKKELER